jgi:hypothetical protein
VQGKLIDFKGAVEHALSEEKTLCIAVKGDTKTWEQSKELATADYCVSLRCERERGLRFLEISDRDGRGHLPISLSPLVLLHLGLSHLTVLEILIFCPKSQALNDDT